MFQRVKKGLSCKFHSLYTTVTLCVLTTLNVDWEFSKECAMYKAPAVMPIVF